MKTLIIYILFIFLLIINSNNPLRAHGFNAVSIPAENFVFAVGDSGRILFSFDSGLSWNNVYSPNVNFNSVYSKGNFTYFTASDNIVYRSYYLIYYSAVRLFPVSGNYKFNAIHFITDSIGFVCGENGAVFKSTNAGENWSIRNTGIPDFKINSISFKDLNNGVVVGDGGKIFTTINGGDAWNAVSLNRLTNRNLLKVKYFNEGIVATGEYGTLLLKRNNSPDWEIIDTRVTSDIYGITGSGLSDVHICGGGGFIRNNLNGNERFTGFEPNPMMANLVDIQISNSGMGFAVSSLNNAIVRTTNGGLNWNFIQGSHAAYQWERKLAGSNVNGNTLCSHPTDRNTFFCGQRNRIFVSRDAGETWSDIAGVPGNLLHSFYVSPVDTNIWVCAISGTPDKILRTSNYGLNWTTSISGNFSNYGQPLEMDQNDPSIFYYAPDGGGFYKSSDNGFTFDLISDFPFQSPCDIIAMYDSSEVLFVGDGPNNQNAAKIFRSSNGGYNWTLVLDNNDNSEIPSMSNSVFRKNILYASESGPDFLKSSDYGVSFESIFRVGYANWATAVCLEDPTLILDGFYNNTCYFSLNEGIDWIYSYGISPFAGLGLLAPSKNTLLYYTTNGIYKLKITYSGVVSVNEKINSPDSPETFTLKQNYPNPFNPVTNLEFQIPKSGFISLKIYDMIGKEIATIVNGNLNPGTYRYEFDGSNFASGVYLYELKAGDFKAVKRMILVK